MTLAPEPEPTKRIVEAVEEYSPMMELPDVKVPFYRVVLPRHTSLLHDHPGRLLIGNKAAAMDVDWLRKQGVTCMLNCTKEIVDPDLSALVGNGGGCGGADSKTMIRSRYPLMDELNASPHDYFATSNEEVLQRLRGGHCVLLFCDVGLRRSLSLAFAYLMRHEGMSLQKCAKLLESLKTRAYLTPAQQKSLLDFEGIITPASDVSFLKSVARIKTAEKKVMDMEKKERKRVEKLEKLEMLVDSPNVAHSQDGVGSASNLQPITISEVRSSSVDAHRQEQEQSHRFPSSPSPSSSSSSSLNVPTITSPLSMVCPNRSSGMKKIGRKSSKICQSPLSSPLNPRILTSIKAEEIRVSLSLAPTSELLNRNLGSLLPSYESIIASVGDCDWVSLDPQVFQEEGEEASASARSVSATSLPSAPTTASKASTSPNHVLQVGREHIATYESMIANTGDCVWLCVSPEVV